MSHNLSVKPKFSLICSLVIPISFQTNERFSSYRSPSLFWSFTNIFFTISGTPVKSEEGESETDEGSLPSRRRRQSSGSSFTMPSTSSAELVTPGKQYFVEQACFFNILKHEIRYLLIPDMGMTKTSSKESSYDSTFSSDWSFLQSLLSRHHVASHSKKATWKKIITRKRMFR